MDRSPYSIAKRAFDLSAAAAATAVSAPLWAVIAAGIKRSSEGPVFYRADRIGKGAKPFTLLKFRSMHQYDPGIKGKGEQREGGYIANADRIFPFGAFLRKSKLDELPQLLNILKGDMAVVGPRPITKAGVEKHYIGKYDRVLSVRPGLACLDSLYDYAHGELVVKDNEEFDKKVAPVRDYLAAVYVDNMSLKTDAYCILRTIRLIIEIGIMGKRDIPYTKYEKEAIRAVLGDSVNVG